MSLKINVVLILTYFSKIGFSHFLINVQFSGPQVIIGTPGRLTDHINNSGLNVNMTSYVVLDEADRMLDMGFEPQIKQILNNIRVCCSYFCSIASDAQRHKKC